MNQVLVVVQIVKLVAELFPVLLQLIDHLESAFPDKGQGVKKLEVLKTTVQGASSFLTGSVLTFEQAWPTIEKVVATVVAAKK